MTISCFSNAIHDHASEVLQLDVVVVHQLAVGHDLLNLLLAHPLAHVHHGVRELFYGDFAVFICVEDFECIDDILECVRVLPSLPDQALQTLQVELARIVCIHLFHHVLDLCLARVEIDSSYQRPQLLRMHKAITILVEEHENLLDLIWLDQVVLIVLLGYSYHLTIFGKKIIKL